MEPRVVVRGGVLGRHRVQTEFTDELPTLCVDLHDLQALQRRVDGASERSTAYFGHFCTLTHLEFLTELGEICDSAAIIEAGQLLAYGTIQEIEQQQRSVSGQTTSRTLLARIASPDDLDGQTDRLEKWLLEQPNVSRVQCATGRATFDYEGDDEGQQNLLKKIIDDGLPVIEFHGKSQSLEDAFMNITQGITQ